MNRTTYVAAFSLAVFALAAPTAHGQATAVFTRLGLLPPGNQFQSSSAYATTDNGNVVVGQARTAFFTDVAVLWSPATGLQQGPTIRGQSGLARNISADGMFIVGTDQSSAESEAFLWSSATQTTIGLGDLPGGRVLSYGFAASTNGRVVVGISESSNGTEAFRWTPELGMVGLGDLPGGRLDSEAYDVSADGNVVIGRGIVDGNINQAFRWTPTGGMVAIEGVPPGSVADAVSADGRFVVGSGDTATINSVAFLWSAQTGMIPLGHLLGSTARSHAYDVSADGRVVVGDSGSSSSHQAFIWTSERGMRNLRDELVTVHGLTELSDWVLSSAFGISADGRTIVGVGRSPDGGCCEAWRVQFTTVVPEPSAMALAFVACGVALIVKRGRRHRTGVRDQSNPEATKSLAAEALPRFMRLRRFNPNANSTSPYSPFSYTADTYRRLYSLTIVCALIFYARDAQADSPYATDWARQFGTSSPDIAQAIAVDGIGSVYVSGDSQGPIGGPNLGSRDIFLRKYSTDGSIMWTRQIGTNRSDNNGRVSVDTLGSIFLTGETDGSLGGTNAGNSDVFISRYDASGALLWNRQLGSPGSEHSYGVAVDDLGNAYIAGITDGFLVTANDSTEDMFLSKYNVDGILQWTRQAGLLGKGVFTRGVSADRLGGVYVCGETSGAFGGANIGEEDVFITKYDAAGALLWSRQFGTDRAEDCDAITADASGNVYVTGETFGAFDGVPNASYASFLRKYDTNGNLLWSRLSNNGSGVALYADHLENIFVAGAANGTSGQNDVFLAQYDGDGALKWTRQLGTDQAEQANGVWADGSHLYVAGGTVGSLFGSNAGGYDAFVMRLSPVVPEPSTISLVGIGAILVCGLGCRRQA